MKEPTCPGQLLFHWILNRYEHQRIDQTSWVTSVSDEFDVPQLEEFLLRSTALMLLRRLLWNAQWYESRFVDEAVTMSRYEKDYLSDVTRLSSIELHRLCIMVYNAVRASKKDISPGLFNSLRKRAETSSQRCQLGGCAIDYSAKDGHNAFSLDHIWPQSLGGSSEDWNLRVACKDCNTKRQNLVEAADSHYEHFHARTDGPAGAPNSLPSELNSSFRLAALLRADFRCELCGSRVDETAGGLDFVRSNRYENYHMFNIQVMCDSHGKQSTSTRP